MAEENVEKKESAKAALTPTIWIASTVILAIALVAFVAGSGITGNFVANGNSGSVDTAASKAIAYIDANMLPEGMTAKLINVTEANGLYMIGFGIQDRNYTAYVTKDGKLLLPQAYDMTAVKEQAPAQPETFEPTKTDKPLVRLFVMSFCPYGKSAEDAMSPVVSVMGDKATIEPHFIVGVMNKTEAESYVANVNEQSNKNYTIADMNFLAIGDSYLQSLHGPNEAKEDMRQALIFKASPEKFWKYVSYVNANCSLTDIETCWKTAANATGVSVSAIESKLATDGVAAMREDQELAELFGVSGSPTLTINGATFNGARTAEGYKTGICAAFNTPPAFCGQTLNDTASAPSGGCG